MTHDINAPTLAAAEADLTLPVYFVDMGFEGGTLRLHTRLGDMTVGGNVYTGTGAIGIISGIAESSEPSRSTFTLTLRGIPNDIISIALNEHYQGRPCVVREGRLDPSTHQPVADPWVLRRGQMDVMDIQQGQDAAITLSVESEFAQWDRPVTRRYTDADQQARFPGDPFFQYVEQAAEKTIYWGQLAR